MTQNHDRRHQHAAKLVHPVLRLDNDTDPLPWELHTRGRPGDLQRIHLHQYWCCSWGWPKGQVILNQRLRRPEGGQAKGCRGMSVHFRWGKPGEHIERLTRFATCNKTMKMMMKSGILYNDEVRLARAMYNKKTVEHTFEDVGPTFCFFNAEKYCKISPSFSPCYQNLHQKERQRTPRYKGERPDGQKKSRACVPSRWCGRRNWRWWRLLFVFKSSTSQRSLVETRPFSSQMDQGVLTRRWGQKYIAIKQMRSYFSCERIWRRRTPNQPPMLVSSLTTSPM